MNTYNPGSILGKKSDDQSTCPHHHVVPLEWRFAKITHPDGYDKAGYYDFTPPMMSANVARVTAYFCLDCHTEIPAPKKGY